MQIQNKLKTLALKNGKLKLPAFFPDATYGKVKGVENSDLLKCKIDGVVVNAYHILKNNMLGKIAKKGIHKYMNFNKPIISDSGGFQVMSLIHNVREIKLQPSGGRQLQSNCQNFSEHPENSNKPRHLVCVKQESFLDNPKLGKIYDDRVVFLLDNNKKIVFTPEKCIAIQLKIGSDIIMCLDDCTKPDISFLEQKKSIERTINWARRCKKYFDKKTKNMKEKPLLFAIVQGGTSRKLRKYCAERLIKMNFDGYSFGGFPMKNKKLLAGILKYVAKLLPDNKPKYAMGIGKPEDIIKCIRMGYNLFDCVLPTRDARHKRLYVWKNKKKLSCETLNIRQKNKKTKKLARLFKTDYSKAVKIATMHNLRFYTELMREMRHR